jgi:ankyrin repeat protein
MSLSPQKQKLVDAVIAGDLSTVKNVVFSYVMSARWENHEGTPVLTLAVQNGHFEIVKFLVDQNAYVNWVSPDHQETLYSIAQRLQFNDIATYLKSLIDPDIQDSVDKISKNQVFQTGSSSVIDFIEFIKASDVCSVQEFISKGFNVNSRFEDDVTSLMVAVDVNNLEIVKLLVAAGADVNALDADFESALSIATMKKLENIIEYLTPMTSDEIKLIIEDQIDD